MNKDNVIGFGVGLFAGAIIGGVMALLYAPESGKKTRKVIKNMATEVVDTVKEETGEVIDKVIKAVDAVKKETGEVVDKVGEAASDAGKKGEAVIKAIKG